MFQHPKAIVFLQLAFLPALICFSAIDSASGQSGPASQYDFVQSSSRLSDGRTVTRTAYNDPRRPSRVVISSPPRVAQYPNRNLGNGMQTGTAYNGNLVPRTAFQANAANSTPSLATPPNQLPTAPPSSLPPHVQNNNVAGIHCNPGANIGQIYPYPATFNNTNLTYGPNFGPQPLIKLRTLPPSTYVGQGILGQPKAYVPGEPVRNFFRYIFP